MMNSFKGTGVAIVTPFLADQSIDFESLTNIINHLINGGIDYIVSLGTTGESVSLSLEEQKQVVQHTENMINQRVPMMVGCGGNYTQAVLDKMQLMQDWGNFDAFLSVSPYYNKPSQEGIYLHYKALAEASKKPIILYNVPGRTSRNIDPETTIRLANECSNIIGIKEAGNNLMQSIELSRNKPDNFLLISGDDDLLLSQLAHGFDGVISVVANAYPKQWSTVVKLSQENKIEEAREIFHSLFDFVQLIFQENNPAGIKCALHEMQLCDNQFRLPVCPVSTSLDAELRNFVRNYTSA